MKSFISWVLSTVLLIILTFWAFLPSNSTNEHVWYYLPDRYYILGFPNWFMLTVYVNCGLIYAYGMYQSHPRDSYLTMVDRHTILR